MVSQFPQKPDVMRMRLRPGAQPPLARVQPPDAVTSSVPAITSSLAPPPWRFEVRAADGAELLVMREEHGLLVVEGDESRWDEAAKRFLHGVMQWAGQAGIPWKDEARKAGEAR
jgi:hypothetical protein